MTRPLESIPWLLESSIPSIRYQTLTRLLDLPADDPRVLQARRDMTASGPVPEILAGQGADGQWTGERSYYTPKYTSTHWAMMLLAELSAAETDALPAMRRGAEFMLRDTQGEVARKHAAQKWDLECLWGNILRYVLECGLEDDPRAHAMAAYLAESAVRGQWTCPHNENQPCAWGAARALWGLAAIRRLGDFPGVEAAIESTLDFLLKQYQLVKADYPGPGGRINRRWFGLNFPLFYQADILFVLRVLGELGRLDHPGAQPALDWLAGQRSANGRFTGASPYGDRTYPGLGSAEETRRWVTLRASWVLKQAGIAV